VSDHRTAQTRAHTSEGHADLLMRPLNGDARVRFDVVTRRAIETGDARDLLDQERLRARLNAIRQRAQWPAGDRAARVAKA